MFKVENLAYRKEAYTNIKKSETNKRNSLTPRSFINMIQEGHPSLAVDGDEDNSLQNCAILDNYYVERPTLVINLGRMTQVGGLVLKTWQGKGQDSNFAYRDFTFGLDRFSVFVDRRPLFNNINEASSGNASISSLNMNQINAYQNKLRLNEYNLCNFVTRNNYAIFSPKIHLECKKPIQGKYIYIQADGRNNRWSKLFSAVVCEVQVYEL